VPIVTLLSYSRVLSETPSLNSYLYFIIVSPFILVL